MAITKADANQAKGVDKAYLLQAILLEQQVQKTLDNFANDSYDILVEHTTSNGLQDADVAIAKILELWGISLLLFDSSMERGIGSIAIVKKDMFLEQAVPLLRSAGANEWADQFKVKLGNLEADTVRSFRTMKTGKYDLSYNDRMMTIDKSSRTVITNLVNTGVRDGISGKAIAQRLDRYVNPVPGQTPVRPWDVMRNATKSTKSFTPKDVLPGSIQSNLIDVARTQTAESYRQATNRAFDNEPWVVGYRWVLSGSHPRPDICDDYAEHGVYDKNDKPTSHNYCLCDWVPEFMKRDQIVELLKAGAI